MKATLTHIIRETKEISSYRLKPEVEVRYTAGQWMDIRLTDLLKHHYTLSSSPTETWLQFTTKFRPESEFKQVLWSKQVGDDVEIKGPFGSFVLDEADTRPKIFIAGGIGITPFRSMIKYMADQQLDLPTTLLYSVKNRGEGAFTDELLSLTARIPSLKIEIIETENQGRLNAEKLTRSCPDWKTSTLWLCGPPGLVEAFMDMAIKMGFAPEAIKSEEFTGY